ncbi:MAG: hypothetical protein ACK40V_01640 [Anaerolineales bacterium]
MTFFTTLKSNRMVSLNKEGGWFHLDEIEWTTERLQNSVSKNRIACCYHTWLCLKVTTPRLLKKRSIKPKTICSAITCRLT